ncbi:hypothetical protein KKA93_02990 [Patescibacteria group bacterium]|nr:hypothetical protein [Patescibacteria group bacterium]MBU1663446.1 hypothetical protein [Patescibacteria group bacterium]MBU1934253.1 hypothetical protein [Patescibacteria group bacterium]MBU2008182.1 hypothetical protein [Patescibacteria group bacterium]MBU2233915.1 hypothetical protein [Patescibacteria group bacterium]
METRAKNKIIKNFKKRFLQKNDQYLFDKINLTKTNFGQKKYSVTKIVEKKSQILNGGHALDLKSYLSLIVPHRFHKQLIKCNFFYLIRGEETEALNFFKKKGCKIAVVIRNKYAKKRFERFLIGYNEYNDELYCSFYNIAGLQRLRHYELLLKLIYGRVINKKLYKVLYSNRYLKQLEKTVKSCCDAQKIIIGYKENVKKIIQKNYKQNPDINIEDDYFSLSYYHNERLIITGHAFGWMIKEILSLIIHQTKIKQLFYIGNCGALNNLKVGQIIFPNNLYCSTRRETAINNILSPKNYNSISHLSVSTPLVETNNFIIKNRKKFSTVDVELYDIIRKTLDSKRKILLGVALLVSDKPGRKENGALVSDERRFQRSLNCVLEKIIKLALPK